MNKITIKNLIDFHGKNTGPKVTFVNNLKKQKDKTQDNPRDYWSSSLSVIKKVFKTNDTNLLDDKIAELLEKKQNHPNKLTKDQYGRNIELISNFKEYEYQFLKPEADINFLKKPRNQAVLEIHGVPVVARPSHIYKFKRGDREEVGGVWFVAKLDGYKKGELGMFTDMMYRYLHRWYSENYIINPDYCITVDLYNGREVKYSELEKGQVAMLLDPVIHDFKNISQI